MRTDLTSTAPPRSRPAPARSPSVDRRALLIVGVTVGGLIVALIGLGRESLWLDEAFSVAIAKRPWTSFVDLVVHREGFMVPYTLVLRGWIAWGDGEVAVRSLSVIAAVAAIPVCYVLTDRLFGRGGFLAATMLAVNAFFVQYAQEARGYALALTLTAVSTLLFVRAIDRPSRWRWAAYAAVSALAVYAHVFAGFVLVAHLLSTAFIDRRRAPGWKAGLVIGGSIALAVSPLAVYFLTTDNTLSWIGSPSPGVLARSVGRLAGAHTVWGAALLVPLVAIGFAGAIVVGVRSWRREGRSRSTWAVALVLGWAVVPLAGAVAISIVKPILVERYLLVALPGVLLAVSCGLLAVRSMVTRIGLWAAIILVSLSQVVALYVIEDKEDWREATTYVVEHAVPGDGVAFYRPFGTVPWARYADEARTAGVIPDPVLPIFDWRRGDLTLPRGFDVAELADADPRFDRVWLLLSQAPAAGSAAVRDVLEADYARTERVSFGPLVVELYQADRGDTR